MTFSLSEEQQKLYDFAAASLPSWRVAEEATSELLVAMAVMFDRARRQIDHYFDMTYVTRATRGGISDPDWLDGLARERGTHKQAGESDEALRDRVRRPDFAVTKPQILVVVEDFLTGRGFGAPLDLISIPREGGFCSTTPASLAEASGHAFAVSSGSSVVGSRACNTRPFGFIVIVPNDVTDESVEALELVLQDIAAGGFTVIIERQV